MYKLLLFLFCLLLFSCGNKKNSISDFSWLEGKWVGAADDMSFFEQWSKLQGNAMNGFGGAVSGKDTVFTEKIKIEERVDGIFYIPTVQENGGSVDFKFTGTKNDTVIFENPLHNFPQRILYLKLPNNKLYACIDGLEKGRYKRIEFSYQKVN